MHLKNTTYHFGIVSILLHWIMAILIIGMLILGLYMTSMPIGLQKLKFYGWHKTFGILALMLVIVRLLWRLQNITPSLSNLPRWEEIAARSVHVFFYILMFAMPLSGWLMTSAAGLPPSFFGWFILPDLISPSAEKQILWAKIHEWTAYTFIAVICAHIAAAFKHYLINKDNIMQRMIRP